jgi:hypothetical protein
MIRRAAEVAFGEGRTSGAANDCPRAVCNQAVLSAGTSGAERACGSERRRVEGGASILFALAHWAGRPGTTGDKSHRAPRVASGASGVRSTARAPASRVICAATRACAALTGARCAHASGASSRGARRALPASASAIRAATATAIGDTGRAAPRSRSAGFRTASACRRGIARRVSAATANEQRVRHRSQTGQTKHAVHADP